ncbi:hypothetical protein BB561_006189 [Smittium simulii]|uniref:Endonuclease lcl3 n=1 Tax=Smittium simulii TaxID=133385 RepID=A0A2T9Y5Z8_9FUNG|nr:hypothetical protein BB561_006189 [Smittium simulii]
MTSNKLQKALVKNVISADTVVLRSVVTRPNQPPPERILALAYIETPRFGALRKPQEDEAYSLEARDFLRKLIVGKILAFEVAYATTSGREYGRLFTPESQDISMLLIENGWAKVNEQTRSRHLKFNSDDAQAPIVQDLLEAEARAQAKKIGLWQQNKSVLCRKVDLDASDLDFLKANKGSPLQANIEQIRDAATYRAYLKAGSNWLLVTLQLSGLRAPVVRTNIPGQPDLIEEFGLEGRNFVETRLLQRDVSIIIENITENNTIIATVKHPAGNIAELITANGLARVVDWSAAFVTGGSEKLRKAEQAAKQKKIGIWKNYVPTASSMVQNKLDAVIVRVINANTVEYLDADSNEHEVQLSSVRPPKASDPQTAGYAEEAKEYLRKRLIGRKVQVKIDYRKPEQDGFAARDCATIKIENKNVSTHLLERGLGYAVRHKRDDENRSSEYDSLLAAEMTATEKKIGIHSGKTVNVVKHFDISTNATRAKSLLPHLTRAGKISALVEFVSQGSRFKIIIQRESGKANFVLAGIKCPRSGPGQPEPFGVEAQLFSKHRILQRDVEIEISSSDNTGAFIGSLYYNKTRNLAVELLEAGLAQIHEYSANQMSSANALYDAENKAKRLKKGIWVNYDASAELEKQKLLELQSEKHSNNNKPNVEFIDIVVSEMIDSNNFYIQIPKSQTIEELEKIMKELSISGKQSAPALSKTPKVGELVAAKFVSDNIWYRARVRKIISSRECEVISIDYGNSENVPLSNIKPIDPKLSNISPVAIQSKFAFLKSPVSDYMDDAFMFVRGQLEGKQLAANIEARTGSGNNQIMHLTVYDSKVSSTQDLISSSINASVILEGFAAVDKKDPASLRNSSGLVSLESLMVEAKKSRKGMWEYGDVLPDEEESPAY